MAQAPRYYTDESEYDPTAIGGKGVDYVYDESGNIMGSKRGTSGADIEAERYRRLGGQPMASPVIDQRRPNETGRYVDDGIGLLDRAARGESHGAYLVNQMTGNAVAGQQSLAASVRGGAGARAAAARGANFRRAGIEATGRAQAAAIQAGEMADARGALMGASSQRRGQDLGLSTDQAKLDAETRARGDQREQFYERLAYEQQQSQMGARLGRNAAAQSAATANRAQSLAEEQAAMGRAQTTAGTIGGGGAGALGGYARLSEGNAQPKPAYMYGGRDDPYSDERTKYVYSDDRTKIVAAKREAWEEGKQAALKSVGYVEHDGKAYRDNSVSLIEAKNRKQIDSDAAKNKADVAEAAEKRAAPPRELGKAAVRTVVRPESRVPAAYPGGGQSPEIAAAEPFQPVYAYEQDQAAALGPLPGSNLTRQVPRRAPAYTYSDERTKVLAGAMRSMKPEAYSYKEEFRPPDQEPGELQVGPMANRMDKDPVARTAVSKDPETGMLMIDKDKAMKLTMGSLAALQKQVDDLRSSRSGRTRASGAARGKSE